jgi:ribosomal protein S18 acetylase RimI-like enzyme
MNDVTLTETSSQDIELLVTLMKEFYVEAAFPLDEARSRDSFQELQRQPHLGRSYLVRSGGSVAGYLVLTLTFSMEYGGLAAFLDDLYLRPAYRGSGVGTAALKEALALATRHGVRAVHLEVGRDNVPAQSLYWNLGFRESDRQLLTRRLAGALHESPSAGDSSKSVHGTYTLDPGGS